MRIHVIFLSRPMFTGFFHSRRLQFGQGVNGARAKIPPNSRINARIRRLIPRISANPGLETCHKGILRPRPPSVRTCQRFVCMSATSFTWAESVSVENRPGIAALTAASTAFGTAPHRSSCQPPPDRIFEAALQLIGNARNAQRQRGRQRADGGHSQFLYI